MVLEVSVLFVSSWRRKQPPTHRGLLSESLLGWTGAKRHDSGISGHEASTHLSSVSHPFSCELHDLTFV